MSKSRELVICDGEELSVVEKPPVGSKTVAKAKENLLGGVNFQVQDLVTVGKFVRLAYAGVVVGHSSLQVAIKKLGFEIAELYNDSGITIEKFRAASNSVVTDLTRAYEFFLDGIEDMALTCMESVSDTAEKMAKEAEALCQCFKDEGEKVKEQLWNTLERKGVEAKELKRLQEEKEWLCKLQGQRRSAANIVKCGEAIEALDGAVGALKRLMIIMQMTAMFWKVMQMHCEGLADGNLMKYLVKAQTYDDPTKRQKVYESKGIKIRTVELYAGWVAVEAVCGEYIKEIQGSREEIQRYLSENPSFEEFKLMVEEIRQVK